MLTPCQGNQAKQIFERARLPYEILEEIWNLADTQQSGTLRLPEFVVAMHLLASYKSGAMQTLPPILPPGLFDAASRLSQPQSPSTPTINQRFSDVSRMPSIPRQFSGSSPQRPPSSVGVGAAGLSNLPLSAQPTGNDWAISPKDKAQFDSIFATVDRTNRGYITGDEAVRFFGNSKLPAETLAQIWDLACITSNGQLNKDEFAVAMYLIRQQRGIRDGDHALPATLPPSLIPPSMRHQTASMPQVTGPVFHEASDVPAKSAAEDLFGLDSLSQSPSETQTTSGLSSSGINKSSPALIREPINISPQQRQSSSVFKPFVPSSSFGQNMVTSNLTGGSTASSPSQTRQQPSAASAGLDDLLGDNDLEVSRKLMTDTTELANLSNQVGALEKQIHDERSKKSTTEAELLKTASQKRDFESRLSQLRTSYEREVQGVRSLEEQLSGCRDEIKKLLRDIAMIEGSHEDIKNQHRQAVSALEAEQKENAALKEKIRALNSEMDALRPQLESIRSEARQQKGMVAINKKQLATSESERDRLKGDIEEASKLPEFLPGSERQVPQRQNSTVVASPTASVMSQSTNPFFRSLSTKPSESTLSPGAATSGGAPPLQYNHSAFDDLFGPSDTSQQASIPPPTTSFRTDSGFKDARSSPATSEHHAQLSGGPDELRSPPQPNKEEFTQSTEFSAPPQQRQLSSSSLPYRDAVGQANLPSSLNDIPASMGGHDVQSRAAAQTATHRESPFGEVTDPEPSTATGPGDVESVKDSQTQSSTIPEGLAHAPLTKPSETDGHNMAPANGAQASYSHPSVAPRISSIPGAFPGETSSPRALTPVGESFPIGQNGESGKPSASLSNPASDTLVGNTRDPERKTSIKDDFDAAFAGFDAPKPNQGQQANGTPPPDHLAQTMSAGGHRIDKEFPPIEELGGDEDSETSSERRFDDDFTPVSAPRGQETLNHGQDRQSTAVEASSPLCLSTPRPTLLSSRPSEPGPLPTPGADTSPPTYNEITKLDNASPNSRPDQSHFPPEFSGLLPSREDPTQHPDPQDWAPGSIPPSGQKFSTGSINSIGAPSLAPTTVQTPPQAQSVSQSTTPPESYQLAPSYLRQDKNWPQPDTPPSQAFTMPLDDDFEKDFADLADAKESDDRDQAHFDLPAPESRSFLEFNPTFDPPGTLQRNMSGSQQKTPSNIAHVGENSSNVEGHAGGPGAMNNSMKSVSPNTTTGLDDWDAIFAGLDTPAAGTFPDVQIGGAHKGPSPNEDIPQISQTSRAPGPTGPLPFSSKPPLPDRTMNTLSDHDDPILKRLIGMGYPRDVSLNALEKYDYNIDKVMRRKPEDFVECSYTNVTQAADYLIRNLSR